MSEEKKFEELNKTASATEENAARTVRETVNEDPAIIEPAESEAGEPANAAGETVAGEMPENVSRETLRENAPSAPKKKKGSGSVVKYIIALFAVCLVLILWSYGNHLRESRLLEEENVSLSQSLQSTKNSLEAAQNQAKLAEKLEEELAELRSENDRLTEENRSLQSRVDELTAAIVSADGSAQEDMSSAQ